jgi:hypothetical protein
MKFLSLVLATGVLLAGPGLAQCPPASGAFATNVSATGVFLNLVSDGDGTNNVEGGTLVDNEAFASPGQPISFRLSNVQGAAGQPFSIYYTAGAPGAPLPLGTGDSVWINLAAPVDAVVDGLGFFGPANAFAAHPGPSQDVAFFTSIPATPALIGACFTVQAFILDPAAPAGLRFSNGIQLGLGGQILMTAPNFGFEGQSLPANVIGSGSGTAAMRAFNPAGATTGPALATGPVAGASFTIPIGAESGPVQYEDVLTPGALSGAVEEDLDHFCAVVSPNGVNPATPGPLTLGVSPFNPAERWASVFGNLATATTVDAWSIQANAGEWIIVECYSVDAGQTRILDGFGTATSPNATEGFDPLLNLTQATNTHPITFDQGAAGPFLLDGDDDDGIGGNARLVFQARAADTYNILVGTGAQGTFVTGDYLLNIRTLDGAPAVGGFTVSGLNPANSGAFGSSITVNGPNITAGNTYTVTFTPVHGLYAPVTVPSVASLVPSALTFSLPAYSPTGFAVGSHYVQVTDDATGATSQLWPLDFFPQANGLVPELFVVRSAAPQAMAGAPNQISPTGNVSYSVTGTAGTTAVGGQLGFAAAAGQTIYVEAIGYDTSSNFRRADAVAQTGNPTVGSWNPVATLYTPGLGQVVAYNDDDGALPSAFNWPVWPNVGISWNAAFLTPAPFASTAAAGFFLIVDEPVFLGAGARQGLVHVVVR